MKKESELINMKYLMSMKAYIKPPITGPKILDPELIIVETELAFTSHFL